MQVKLYTKDIEKVLKKERSKAQEASPSTKSDPVRDNMVALAKTVYKYMKCSRIVILFSGFYSYSIYKSRCCCRKGGRLSTRENKLSSFLLVFDC